jgi:hypothetical protein
MFSERKVRCQFLLRSSKQLGKKEFLCNVLGLESRDDSNHHTSTRLMNPKMTFEVGDIVEGIHHPF